MLVHASSAHLAVSQYTWILPSLIHQDSGPLHSLRLLGSQGDRSMSVITHHDALQLAAQKEKKRACSHFWIALRVMRTFSCGKSHIVYYDLRLPLIWKGPSAIARCATRLVKPQNPVFVNLVCHEAAYSRVDARSPPSDVCFTSCPQHPLRCHLSQNLRLEQIRYVVLCLQPLEVRFRGWLLRPLLLQFPPVSLHAPLSTMKLLQQVKRSL